MSNTKLLFTLLTGLFFTSSAFAFADGPFPASTSGNTTSFSRGPVTPSNVNRFNFSTASNGDPLVSYPSGQRAPLPGGGSIPVEVFGKVPKSTAMQAWGRFAKRSLPILATFGAALDLMRDLGYDFDTVPYKTDPGSCTVGPCYEYSLTDGTWFSGWLGSPSAVGSAWVAYKNQNANKCVAGSKYEYAMTGAGSNYFLWKRTTTSYANSDCTGASGVATNTGGPYVNVRSRAPDVPTRVNYTIDDVLADLDAKDYFSPNHPFSPAVKEAIQNGEEVEADPTGVTGPASSPGVQKVEQNVTNNTTTTTTTTNNHTYSGPSITTNVSTSVITINNTTGETISETNTTETPVIPEEKPFEMLCGLPGLPPCNVKVDETGTKQTGDYSKAETALTDGTKAITDAMTNSTQRTDIGGYQWSFVFPTGTCQAIPLGWSIWRFTLDLCNFPMINYFRAFWAWAFGVMGALYAWRSATSAV